MKRKIILLLCLSFLVLVPMASAEEMDLDNDPIHNLFNGLDADSGVTKEYSRYNILNYQLDTDIGRLEFLEKGFESILNVVWLINIFIVRFTIVVIQQAFTLNFYDNAIGYLDAAVLAVKAGTWDIFFNAFLGIAAIAVLWNGIFRAKTQRAWQQLMVLVIILGVAYVMVTKPGDILKSFNDVSRFVSSDIMVQMMPLYADDADTLEDGVVVMGNMIWRNHVLNPWYILNFGNVKDGADNASSILPLSYNSSDRNDFVSEQVKDGNLMMNSLYIPIRILLALIFIVQSLAVLGITAFFSILILAYQLVPLVLLIFSGLVLLVSLWPGIGLSVLEKWLGRIVMAVISKVIISIFLSIFLLLTSIMYKVFDGNIIMQLLAVFVIMTVLFMEKNRIMGFFTTLTNRDAAAQNMQNDPNVRRTFSEVASKVYLAQQGFKGFNAVRDGLQRKRLQPAAVDYLQNQYFKQKAEAEKRSTETQTPVEYSDFVKQVDERQEQGLPLYTGDQIKQATETLADIEKQKGNVSKLTLPTGVTASSQDEYSRAVKRYKDEQQRKQEEFNKRRIRYDSLTSRAVKQEEMNQLPKPLKIKKSDQVKERQEQARQQRLTKPHTLTNAVKTAENVLGATTSAVTSAAGVDGTVKSAALVGGATLASQGLKALSSRPKFKNEATTNTVKERQDFARSLRKTPPGQKVDHRSEQVRLRQEAMKKLREEGDVGSGFKVEIEPQEPQNLEVTKQTSKGDTVKYNQEIARKLRRTPPSSVQSFSPNEVSATASNEEIKNAIRDEWKKNQNILKTQANHVDQLMNHRREAFKQQEIIKLYQSYEENGNLDTFKTQFPDEAKQVQMLKDFTNKSTVELVKQAQDKYKGISKKVDVAKKEYKLDTKKMIKVNNPSQQLSKEIKVLQQSEYEMKVLNGPTPPKKPQIKITEEMKQRVINEWNQHQENAGASPEQFLNELRAQKRDYYKTLDIFNKGHKATKNQTEQKQYEDMANRYRTLYLDSKERFNIACEMFGKKPNDYNKLFKKDGGNK